MKIILMGQQAFGKSTLEKFYKETDHEIVAVYCAPDKEGKPLDPVKEYALSENLPVFQPSNFKDKEVLDFKSDTGISYLAYIVGKGKFKQKYYCLNCLNDLMKKTN